MFHPPDLPVTAAKLFGLREHNPLPPRSDEPGKRYRIWVATSAPSMFRRSLFASRAQTAAQAHGWRFGVPPPATL
jgi:hypothetical protein